MAGFLTCGSMLSASLPKALCFSDFYRWRTTSHLQLRVQFRYFTGFPFTPWYGAPLREGVAHTPVGGKVGSAPLTAEEHLRSIYAFLPSMANELRIVMIFNGIADAKIANKLPIRGQV